LGTRLTGASICSRQAIRRHRNSENADPDSDDGDDGRDDDRDELGVIDDVDRGIADGPHRGQAR
jgi:hypothetical protein